MIAIANVNRADVERTERALDIAFPLVPGPNRDLQRRYGAYDERARKARPATFVIDKAGVVRFEHIGRDDEDRPSVEQILKVLGALK